jgi:hypothetical protein
VIESTARSGASDEANRIHDATRDVAPAERLTRDDICRHWTGHLEDEVESTAGGHLANYSERIPAVLLSAIFSFLKIAR